MDKKNESARSGLGLASVLAVVFIVLKLTGLIQWSWVWVLSPIWISFLVVAVILLIALVAALVAKRK